MLRLNQKVSHGPEKYSVKLCTMLLQESTGGAGCLVWCVTSIYTATISVKKVYL